ncbi:hypothetical protein [Natronolimnobius baerhuensis]|uniref:DUF7968 domain-containing protein n=1 Tax=Natronolimnobius baerhuensis TaxID=253108 RepID=A0A202E9B4_9EURY|nr:hypothetical protein [Natronolimnobius baerhuensis]OVE84866.1 hypothetical protein B2G88_10875 [Natronolimnobius baerhuensis]
MTNGSDQHTDPRSAAPDSGSDGTDHADRVVVSYPEDLSEWGLFQLEKSSFRTYLLKVHDDVAVGDVWEEFLDVGCCGSAMDVSLRVERLEGGTWIDQETTLEYESRDSVEMDGSWQAQSEGGPKRA